MSETKIHQDYQLQGNPVIEVPVPLVGNLVYDELGELVLARLNERFRGNSIEYSQLPNKGQSISFSSTPRALAINQILREETNNRIRVLSPEEVVRYWNSIPDKPDTYSDTNSIAVYQNEGPHEALRKRVLQILGIESTDEPLIVSNLGIERADNDYGFTFVESQYQESIKAPFLQKDGKVEYDAEKGLVSSENGISIYTSSDQSGLRRACRDWDGDLVFWYDRLWGSYADGRVNVVSDPAGSRRKFR